MTRILIVGDSHAARMFSATKDDPTNGRSGVTVEYVAAVGPVATMLRVDDGLLGLEPSPAEWNHYRLTEAEIDNLYNIALKQITDKSGTDRLDLTTYDKLVFMGGWVAADWRKVARSINSGHYSQAAIKHLATEVLKRSRHYQWLRQGWPDSPKLPVFSIAEPILNEAEPAFQANPELSELSFPLAFDYLRSAGEDLGLNLFSFPVEFLNSTQSAVDIKYKRGSGEDIRHVNDAGSRKMLERILDIVL